MIDLLIIHHENDTPIGSTLQWAQDNNLSIHVWSVAKEPAPYQASDFKALVICGGSMDTFEEELFPWLKIEKAFIKECILLNKPIFGLCLGSQLLAEVLGGRSYCNHKWEIGFIPVKLLDENERELSVFHWHQCTFELPPGAKLLATNDFCSNQAFTWGNNIIATQFHPEAMDDWILKCADWVTEESYTGLVQTKKEMLESISLQKPLQQWYFNKLTNWFPF